LESGWRWGRDSVLWRGAWEEADNLYGGFVFAAPNAETRARTSVLAPWTWQQASYVWGLVGAGAFENRTYESLRDSGRYAFGSRDFQAWTGGLEAHLGNSWKGEPQSKVLEGQWEMRLRYGEYSRVPAAEELFSQGPHLAAWSYDIGNADLPLERGREWEFSTSLSWGKSRLQMAPFWRDYDQFLQTEPTGRLNTRNGSNLPIWQVTAVPARFYGFEVQWTQALVAAHKMDVQWNYLVGERSDRSEPLPLMSPWSVRLDLEGKHQIWRWGGGLRYQAAKAGEDLAPFETPTDEAWTADLWSSLDWHTSWMGAWHGRLTLAVDNVANATWRSPLNRTKDAWPEKGREFRLVWSADW
jgi:outer membrane receptor protein involved in Fe transport